MLEDFLSKALKNWRRGPRASFVLGCEHGVYALYLREGADLPGITPGDGGLIYIGLAANRKGLKGRCHFNARTRNHSPRKSLAVLLMDELALKPVLVPKPNSPDTWGLEASSEARLSAWMHDNLELAIELCDDPDARETELVTLYAPPLNLTKCLQTAEHQRIAEARSNVLATLSASKGASLKSRAKPKSAVPLNLRAQTSAKAIGKPRHPKREHTSVGSDIDTAEAIAARYGLNPKSYRQRLRDSILWYRKPQDWTFPVGSPEWRDMIKVAERMAH